MNDDELSYGWQDYWINYKKQYSIAASKKDYVIQDNIPVNTTIQSIYRPSNTISIQKEKRTIHIKL